MRRTLVAMSAVLAVSLAVCFASLYMHTHVIEEMGGLCTEAIENVRSDDLAVAVYKTGQMLELFRHNNLMLELVAPHDDLHEALACLRDAAVALECEDMDDAYQSLVSLHDMLEHLHEHEAFSLANLL